MKSFRNPKYLEREEDVVFDLEQNINVAPANNTDQVRNNLKFIADNSGEVTPFDWYNARIALDFKVEQRDGTDFVIGANVNDDSILVANRAQITAYEADQMGIVNGANSFISRLSVLANGKELYQCNYANHSVNIKNLLEYNKSYANSVATNEFYFLDTTTSANKNRFTRRNVTHRRNAANGGDEEGLMIDNTPTSYNEGFAKRKALLGTSSTVRCEIPLNRYSFFEALEDKLLPNTKIEINFEIEKDNNLIWRTGGNACRVVITKLRLFVPRLIFNSVGSKIILVSISNHTNGLISMKLFKLTSLQTKVLVILKLQMEFQNHGMYLFSLSILQTLNHTQQIHFYTILSVFPQTRELSIDAILKLEMEMSTQMFITHPHQILQEFLEM